MNSPLVRDYLSTLAASVVVVALGVASGSIAARLLMPAGRGQLAAIQLWPSFLAVLATVGMPEAIAYFTARHRDRSREYLTSGLVLALLVSMPLGLAAFSLLPALLHAFGPNIVAHARLYLLFIPAYALVFLPTQALRGVRQFAVWNLLRVVPSAVWLAVLVGFLLLQHQHAGSASPGALTNVYLISFAVLSLAVLAIGLLRLPGSMAPRPSTWRSLVRFGLPVLGATLPVTLSLRLDQLVMTVVVSPTQLGIYVVAVAWAGAPLPALNSLGSIVLPRIAGTSDRGFQRALLTQVSRTAILLAITVTIPLMFITPLIIPFLFGQAFSSAIPSAYLLLVASAFLGLSYILTECLLGLECTSGPLRAQALGFVATALSLAVLLPRFGILGAASSSLIGYATNSIALVFEAKHATGASHAELCLPRTDDVRALLRAAKSTLRVPGR